MFQDLNKLPVAILGPTEDRTYTRHDGSKYTIEDEEQITFPKGDEYVYKCQCGCDTFVVYVPKAYETRVRCTNCGNDKSVHSG
jgi:hypothetical protein